MTEDQKKNLLISLDSLKNSPIFNLSLSSKELFHSNFLYWLSKKYPEKAGELFLSLLNLKKDDSKIHSIEREKGNIDLSFKFSDGESVFIENKVKSIPFDGQLQNYSDKLKNVSNVKFALLSLSTPEFYEGKVRKVINGVVWFLITYKDLSEKLEEWTLNDSYHQSLLKDYLILINVLVQINEACSLNEDDLFDFHDDNSDQLKKLKELRMHDFYLKKMYEKFAYKIHKSLVDKFGESTVHYDEGIKWKEDSNNIYVNHGMTRATGLVDIKYIMTNEVALGIQIQGQHYRKLIECTKEYTFRDNLNLINIAENLKKDNLWFIFRNSLFDGNTIYPKGKKTFNKYGDVFKYKSVKLGTDRTIKEIIDLIIRDLDHIKSYSNSIKKMI